MDTNTRKVNLIFLLYHLGLSKYSLSQMYKVLTFEQLQDIYDGFFDVALNVGIEFTKKDIELLSDMVGNESKLNEGLSILNNFFEYKVKILFYYDSAFPKKLKTIANPPLFLFARGDYTKLNSKYFLSIAGSRKISEYGANYLVSVVKELCKYNIGTVSGLALGTDIIAHRVTYQNKGITVAILPNSIFDVTPKSHLYDAIKIIESGGVLISEYYEDNHSKGRYIERNRLISGFSDNLLLTEFDIKSGTMHTARFAWKQNRNIFCFDTITSGNQAILNSGEAKPYISVEKIFCNNDER